MAAAAAQHLFMRLRTKKAIEQMAGVGLGLAPCFTTVSFGETSDVVMSVLLILDLGGLFPPLILFPFFSSIPPL